MIAFLHELEKEGRQKSVLLFTFTIIQIAAYYLSSALVNGTGPLAIPQPDTLLYCQAARRIAEGHAFSFSAGTAVSTGTTSVLYPFVLAVPYVLGLVGNLLITAGFILNAFIYLIFIFCWIRVFAKLLPEHIAFYASVLLVLFPQPVYCALAQSDTGLWMAISSLCALTLVLRKYGLSCLCFVLSPWVRPEGTILSLSLLIVAFGCKNWRNVGCAIAGLISSLGVAVFNFGLTGAFGYSSVANKGYFKSLPFANAVMATGADVLSSLKMFLFGMTEAMPQSFYFVPLLSGLALLAGVFLWKWKKSRDWPIIVFSLGCIGSIVIVGQSGWQGGNADRYFAWFMPVIVLLSALGWWLIAGKMIDRHRKISVLLIPVVFCVLSSVFFLCRYHNGCEVCDRDYRFAEVLDEVLPAKSSIGAWSGCGMAYAFGDRRFAHLCGIYSPEFLQKEPVCALETLKNEPTTRFDYWVTGFEKTFEPIYNAMGEILLTMPSGQVVRKTDWRIFDAAAEIPKCKGFKLVDRVDVGYEKDEARSGYRIVLDYAMRNFEPVVKVDALSDKKIFEIGRVVIGYDDMNIGGLTVGKPLYIIMRTASKVTAKRDSYPIGYASREYCFSDMLDIDVSIDGKEVACCPVKVSEKGFTDVLLVVEGDAINRNEHLVSFKGDHVAYAYWFYQ